MFVPSRSVQITPTDLAANKTVGEKESERLMVGDWVAQWDKAYNTWFYYNTKTGAVSLSILPF